MQITDKMNYDHLLYMMMQGEEWQNAVTSVTFSAPNFAHEGVAGYVETKASFEVRNLTTFTKLWNMWYDLPSDTRLKLAYGKKGTRCV